MGYYIKVVRDHSWRDAMPTPEKVEAAPKEYYYHQIFFHYVLQDGQRAHCAWDRGK